MPTTNPLHQQLAALPPLVLPEPVSWWPPAPVWWVLVALFTALALWALRLAYRYWQRRRAIKQLLAALERHYNDWQRDADAAGYLYHCNALLRRCTRHYFPGRIPVSLRGNQWLAQLDQLVAKPCLHSDTGQQLLQLYAQQPVVDIPALNQVLQQWLQQLAPEPPAAGQIYRSGSLTTHRQAKS